MARAATFTTYLNAKTDSTIDSAFARLQNVSTSTYGTIARAAEAAQKANAGLLGGKGSGGLGASNTINRALTERATAIKQVSAAASSSVSHVSAFSTAVGRESVVAAGAARNNEALARSLQTTARAFSVVQGPLGPIAGRLTAIGAAVQELTGFRLGLVGVAATLFSIGRLGNDYAVLEGRLRPYFETQSRANQAFNDVVGIANRARSSLEPVLSIYTRLTAAAGDLGISQSRISRAVEISSKAATLSGGNSETQRAGLGQFAQALGSNSLGGDELKSIKENTTELALAIAHGFKKADGQIGTTIGNLKLLGSQGKLTADVILDALDRSALDIETRFNRLPVTLSSAGTKFVNSLTVQVGKFDQAAHLTSTLASALVVVADNLNTIIGLAVGVGAAFAGIKFGPAVQQGIASLTTYLTGLYREQELKRGTALLDRQYAIEQAAESQSMVLATEKRIAALRAEQTALAETIAELRVKAQAESDLVGRARASSFGATTIPNATGGLPTIVSTDVAMKRSAAATRELAVAESELRGVTAGLSAEQKLLGVQTSGAHVAVESMTAVLQRSVPASGFAATGVNLLKKAGSSLISFFGGPWGIGIGLATTALYLLATAESAAEQATRKNEEAQRSFETAIDRTTGKIYAQIGVLELQARQKQQTDAVRVTLGQAVNSKQDLVDRVRPFFTQPTEPGRFQTQIGGPNAGRRVYVPSSQRALSPGQQEVNAAALAFQNNEPGSLGKLQTALAKNADAITGLRAALPSIGTAAQNFRTQIQGGEGADGKQVVGLGQARARARILAGSPRPGDLSLAFGDQGALHQQGIAKTKVSTLDQQADAAAKAKSSNDVTALRGKLAQDLQELKTKYAAGGISDEDYRNQRQQLQETAATAIQGVRDTEKARKAAASEAKKDAAKAARDAKQDALDAAATRRDEALIALAQSDKKKGTDEYIQAREKILSTYDAEVGKIDSSRAASHSGLKAMLADIEAEKKASASRGEKRSDILGRYSEEPKARVAANDKIDDLGKFVGTSVDSIAFLGKTKDQIEEIKKINPLGTGIYTQAMADADAARIEQGLRKPLTDLQEAATREFEVTKLILEGRNSEAEALRKAFTLYDQIGEITQSDYGWLVKNEQQQARINDLLSARGRITALIQGTVDSTRDSFEQFLLDIPEKGIAAGGDLIKSFRDQIYRISVRQLTEKLFAGADDKVRALLEGRSKVDTAISSFADSMGRSESSLSKLTSAFEDGAAKISAAAQGISTAPATVGDSSNTIAALVNSDNGFASLFGGSKGGGGNLSAFDPAANDNDIIVTGAKLAKKAVQDSHLDIGLGRTPSALDVSKTIFSSLGGQLDKAVDSLFGKKSAPAGEGGLDAAGGVATGSKFFSKMGDTFGTALQGAGIGKAIGGLTASLGLKGGGTGSQIGGAIGGVAASAFGLPPIVGQIVGSVFGGIIGSLFYKAPKGQAGISTDQFGNVKAGTASGTSVETKQQASSLAKSVSSGVEAIADALGGKITGSTDVQIGTYKGEFRVNDHGGAVGGVKGSGAVGFGTDQEAAIAFAIGAALQDGVISGISDASKKILASGQDLQRAINKAITIESIPKRLLALTDPVKSAVTVLNTEFSQMITTLKEGGATAAQFADAQKLYDLSRAEAIKQATAQAAGAIDAFLKEMVGGQSSPLNKKSVYDNAKIELDRFKADIAAGKIVDQNDLTNAAKNFQDASRGLYGSSQSFFDDFEALRTLLTQARDNAQVTDVSQLPPSPFATDAAVQAAIANTGASTVDAINAQTGTLADWLEQIRNALVAQKTGTGAGGSADSGALSLLPSYTTLNDTLFKYLTDRAA